MPDFDWSGHEALRARLAAVTLPNGAGLSAAEAVTKLELAGNLLKLQLQIGYPFARYEGRLREQIQAACAADDIPVELNISWHVPSVIAQNNQSAISGVKNIVAVASGKGGVGKSTTAVNIALALAAEGARVGMLDADIYGPSQALMLGVRDTRPQMHSENRMQPILAHGLQMISMGNLVTENTPMVWRGPMVSGALQQLLNQTHWDELDYLIVDMPPGTGDIQLTLSQSVPVSASVIVTTPQDIALLDAKKGIEMFRKVNIPVLGIVENMSMHTCSQCGHQEAIFGTQGGDRLALEYQVEVLGRLPLQMSIREQTDRGEPPLIAEPESEISQSYRSVALKVAAGLWNMSRQGQAGPTISMSDD